MKLRAIESGRIKPGYAVTFSEAELNAWANDRVPRMFDGIRNQRVQLGSETATASALIDFVKVRQSEGLDTSAVVARLFEGERPVRVVLRVESGAGRAIVSPVSLEISGVAVTGKVLDFLVTRFFVPLFPEAKVGEPFELRDDIERIEIRPRALRVVMKR